MYYVDSRLFSNGPSQILDSSGLSALADTSEPFIELASVYFATCIYIYFSELVLGSIEQKKEDRKQQLKDKAEEERRMKILTS